MKEVTKEIIDQLNNKELKDNFNDALASNPKATYAETTLIESYNKFNIIKEILNKSAETLELDLLSADRRNQINSQLSTLIAYRSNPTQIIIQIDQLYDIIMSSGLMVRLINKRDYSKEMRDLANLRTELEKTLTWFNNSKNSVEQIDNYRDRILNLFKAVENHVFNSEEELKKINSNSELITDISKEAETSLDHILESYKEIDIKKLSISTFSENIDEYKISIEEIEKKAKEVILKETKINELISQAETALNLKSAQGISAAFASQYNETNNGTLKAWMVGSSVFIGCALLMTIWIVGGWYITDPTSWSSIIGRIVAVGITISGATFCANQYRRQKTLAEDYAYKAVLSKSIVAFTDEIKKRDEDKVSDYLTKVLDEIHKDPQRSRTKNTKLPKLDTQALLEKALEKIPSSK